MSLLKRLYHARRLTRSFSATISTEETVKNDFRDLMRRAAQPVAVVTALTREGYRYHGATLSSFTSIALDPTPLVAFSLRMPSRLASAIKTIPPEPFHTTPCREHPRRTPASQGRRLCQRDREHVGSHTAHPQ